jgi:DNA adenine methylase
MTYSPLRYPGGKNRLAPFIAKVCVDNGITEHYVEPYSGGAAVALFLLFEGFVNRVTINDSDRSIYAFWHSVLNQTDDLCDLIKKVPVTIDEWRNQREIQANKYDAGLLELGFSTFFLNRTNRSGIIKGGIIGGINQLGQYKMDCRFNKEDLIKRIRMIASHRDRIDLYNVDALQLVELILKNNDHPGNLLFYFDPPYYVEGHSLYMNYYKKSHHQIVSEKIKQLLNIHWIVSYDNAPEIRNLYSDCNIIEYDLNHTAAVSKKGKELVFLSPNIQYDAQKLPPNFKLKKTKKIVIYKE